ncbi:transcriptional regulator [cyanobacterium TDX16]|nr:transcriptional regulator [cyanobacterium TDX16]
MSRRPASIDSFSAIADPTRRAVLDMLRVRERPVKEIAKSFRMKQPSLSQHLRVLRDAGLVTQRRSGRERLYRIQPQELKPVAEWITQYERFWRHKLRDLSDHLEKQK